MKALSQFRAALRNWLHRRRVDAELDEEIRAYTELAADEQAAGGAPLDEARRNALVELGGMETVKQAVREARAGHNWNCSFRTFAMGCGSYGGIQRSRGRRF